MKDIAEACLRLMSQGTFTAIDVAARTERTPRQAAGHLRTLIDAGAVEYVKTKPAVYRVTDADYLIDMVDGTQEKRTMQRAHALLSLWNPSLPPKRDADHEYGCRHNPDAQGVLQLPRRSVYTEAYLCANAPLSASCAMSPSTRWRSSARTT
jgi:hypothetical protein